MYIGDKENKLTVYDFTDSRKRDGPRNVLSGFKGYLQADAFAGYDCIYNADGVLEVACMAHARRKFFDCLNSNKQAATEVIEMIKELYHIEKEGLGLTTEERRSIRLAKSAPLLNKIKQWLNQQRLYVLPKSPLGKAVTYALNNWRALCRHLCDGELSIDNNYSERAMRTIAVGRKNWLFAGSKDGGQNTAIIATLSPPAGNTKPIHKNTCSTCLLGLQMVNQTLISYCLILGHLLPALNRSRSILSIQNFAFLSSPVNGLARTHGLHFLPFFRRQEECAMEW